MTLVANPLPVRGPEVRRGALTGTWLLVRHIVRRDRVRTLVWTASITGFVAYFAVALSTVFDDEALAARAAVMRTPTGIVMGGPGYGLDDYRPTVAIANEGILWIVLALAIMSIVHVVRHTRAEEENERAELVRASVVGRHAPAVAALATLTGLLAVIALLAAGTLVALTEGEPAADAFALMFGSAGSALVFGAIAAVTAQVTAHARSATGLAIAAFGVFFVIRVAGDLQEIGGSALSWASPIAWAQQMRPYVELRWWPVGLAVAASAAFLVLAAALASRRDVGAALMPSRAGRSSARRWLASPFALAWRQQRVGLIWTTIGLGLLWYGTGTMMSTLDDMVSDLTDTNPALAALFGTDASAFTESFLDVMMLFVGLCAAGYAVVVGQRPAAEETSGRLEIVTSAPVSRTGWLGAQLLVSTLGVAILLLVSIAALWAGVVSVGIEDPSFADFARVFAFHLPAVLVYLVAGTALFAWAPRAIGAAWALLAFTFVVGMFGAIFDLPDWVLGISPFHWTDGAFASDAEWAPVVILAGIVVAVAALALVGFRRRDVRTG